MAHSNDVLPSCSRVSALREELKQLKAKTKVEMESTLADLEKVKQKKEEKDKQVAELMQLLNNTDNRTLFQRVASKTSLHNCQSEMNLNGWMPHRPLKDTNRFFSCHRLETIPSTRCIGDDHSENGVSVIMTKNLSTHRSIASYSDSESDFDALSLVFDSGDFNYDHDADLPRSTNCNDLTGRIHKKKRNPRRFEAIFKSKQERDAEALQFLSSVETKNKEIIERLREDIQSKDRKILDWQHVVDHQSSQILCLRNEINEIKDQKIALADKKTKHRDELLKFPRHAVSAHELSDLRSLSFQKKIEFRGVRRMSRSSTTSNLSHGIYSGLEKTKYASKQNASWEINKNEPLDPRDMPWQTLASYYNERKAAAATVNTKRSLVKNIKSTDLNSSELMSVLKKKNKLAQETMARYEIKLRTLKFQLANEAFNYHGTKLELDSRLKATRDQLEAKQQHMKISSERIENQVMENNIELYSMRIRVGFMDKISGRCYKRLTDKILKLIPRTDKQSNILSPDKKEHEIDALKKIISKASNALRKEIGARKGEQKTMMKSTWNKLDPEDLIKKALNCTQVVASFADDTNISFGIDKEFKQKIENINLQSVMIQRKMKRVLRFYRHQLFLLILKMNKDSPLNNMQDNENIEEDNSIDGELSDLNEVDAQAFDNKNVRKQLLSQRDAQKQQIRSLQKDLLELTKMSKDNGERENKTFDDLRSQLRHCVKQAKSKNIVISALQFQIKTQKSPV